MTRQTMKSVLRLSFLTCAVVAVSWAANAHGSLVMITDALSPGGANNVTRDTDTGLEWLDWTASTNFSYNSMVTMFDPGDDYAGWRHATRDEVKVLMSNAGLPVDGWPNGASVADAGDSFFNFSGFVGTTSTFSKDTYALTADFDLASSVFTARGGTSGVGGGGGSSLTYAGGATNILTAQEIVGHALVRAVPEPSSLALFGMGSLGMLGLDRRRRKQKRK